VKYYSSNFPIPAMVIPDLANGCLPINL
jgi:hypothetical protein